MLVIIGFFQFQREKTFRTNQLNQELSVYNYTVNKFIQERKPDWNKLKEYVQIFPDSTLRVTVIDTTGEVTFDSFVKEGTKLENHLYRPEIVMANTSENGQAIRHSVSTGKEYYYLAHRFQNYYVRSAMPYNVSLINTLRANDFFLYFMIFILVIAAVVLYFISRSFTKSIDRLRVFTQKAKKEELPDYEIEFPNDELGEISKDIVKLYKLQLQTKDQVKKEREKLIEHLQISQEGLAIFSSEKKEILANTNFIQFTNILSDQRCENSDQIFILPEFADINKFLEQSLLNKELKQKRIIVEKNGRIFAVQCIIFQDSTFEISINDISVQEHENELKRHLTQNISHELKTPVSSILGYMESILENPDIDLQRQRFFIQRSLQQAQRLRDLLQDIFLLNKMDEGKHLLDKETCNISDVISDVLNDVNLQIEQKGGTILKNYRPDLEMKANRSLLYSIFRNLIDNALTYGGEKLTIDINCYREDNQFYYFSFSDNGIGVDEQHLSHLFERFYRVDKGRSRKMGGTGLGLAIVKNAVIFHQGTISAKNNPTGGLNIIFSLKKY
jgi:signal transduction histidine kinase